MYFVYSTLVTGSCVIPLSLYQHHSIAVAFLSCFLDEISLADLSFVAFFPVLAHLESFHRRVLPNFSLAGESILTSETQTSLIAAAGSPGCRSYLSVSLSAFTGPISLSRLALSHRARFDAFLLTALARSWPPSAPI